MADREVMDPVVSLLRSMVDKHSPTGEEQGVAEVMVEEANARGMEAHIDKAGNFVAHAGEGPMKIALIGHIDTVPGELEVTIKEEEGLGTCLTGRGTVDAKGPMAAMLEAASRFVGSEKLVITVIGCVAEEGDSRGAHFIAGTMPRPDIVIVGEPGGWDAVTIGYKGTIKCRFIGFMQEAHRASSPGKCPNTAAEMAVEFWNGVRSYCAEHQGDGLFGSLTCCLVGLGTETDGVECEAGADVDIRIPPGLDPKEVSARLRSIAEKVGGDVVLSGEEHPVVVDKNNLAVRSLVSGIRSMGGRPSYKKKTGTSDMNLLARAWPEVMMATYGPGDSKLDHTPEERIQVSHLVNAVGVLGAALGSLAKRV